MVVDKKRKTSKEIKERILSHLKEGPSSTKKLSDLLGSNWSTINTYLEELKEEGEVREIYSRENLKVYVRTDYPVFYGLPLSEDKIKKSLALLSKIIERWNIKKGEQIAKVPLQKVAVDLIKNNTLDIPVVRFHYGKVLATYIEPQKYQEVRETYKIVELNIPDSIIDEEIKKHSNISWKEKKRQYETHEDMEIFNLADKIYYLISKDKIEEKDKILELFNEILLDFPIGEKYSNLFNKYHEFVEVVHFIFNTKEFEQKESTKAFLKEILETFDAIWQGLTTEFFFEDIKPYIQKDYLEIFEFIKESKLQTYYSEIEEKINNLLDYKTSLNLIEIKLDKTEKEILNILIEGANEE